MDLTSLTKPRPSPAGSGRRLLAFARSRFTDALVAGAGGAWFARFARWRRLIRAGDPVERLSGSTLNGGRGA